MIFINERNTVQKTMILQAVRSMTNHPTAEQVYDQVALQCPGISKATVYRDLNRLARSGEILRVEVANAPDRYDLTSFGHTHCLCSVCGRVYDYRLKVEPELDEQGNRNFKAESFSVMVNGICNNCRENANG